MRKKLLSLALVLAMALSLAPAALAAGQFTDVPDTSPFAAPIAWAVEKQITNGTTPTTFGPKNTCTTSHILTFLWRANGRPGDAGDEKAAVTAWANGLGIDTSDLAAPCTRANAVTYMWKAAGSPAPAETASFADVAADAPYASAVSWAVEKGVTKGTSDTAFSPYDTCTRGQIVTFLCRQLDPEAAKAQPAAPAQPETPAAQPDSPEAVLAAIQGVWREESTGGISERWIEGNTFTMATLSTTSSSNLLVSSSTSFTLEGPTENGEYELRSSEGVLHQIRGAEGKAPSTAELSSGSDALLKVKKSSSSGEWIVYNTGLADTVYNFSRASESLLAEKLKALQDQVDQQQAAISQYATYADFPGVPDFGAIYDIPVGSIVGSTEEHKSFYYGAGAINERTRELFPDLSSTLAKEYRKILEECGFTLTDTRRTPNSPVLEDHTYRGNGYIVTVGYLIPTTRYAVDELYIFVMRNT